LLHEVGRGVAVVQMAPAVAAGALMDITSRTLFCGDLFTQGGDGDAALTEADILGPSEAFRAPLDYFAQAPQTIATLERLAREQPCTLACMAARGGATGGALLRHLAEAVGALSGREQRARPADEALLADAEAREDRPKELVGRERAGDLAERVVGEAQLLGE
jgi:hypothetical protein